MIVITLPMVLMIVLPIVTFALFALLKATHILFKLIAYSDYLFFLMFLAIVFLLSENGILYGRDIHFFFILLMMAAAIGAWYGLLQIKVRNFYIFRIPAYAFVAYAVAVAVAAFLGDDTPDIVKLVMQLVIGIAYFTFLIKKRGIAKKLSLQEKARLEMKRNDARDTMANTIAKAKDDSVKKATPKKNNQNYEEQFKKIVGLESVKDKIRELDAFMQIQREKEKRGATKNKSQSYHMVFTGNPGTGKTTFARIIADIYYNLGIIEENKLIEANRVDLVGQYIGDTAIKTKEKIEEALGGILFIDEAYTLAEGGKNDFGREAINTLLADMENFRDRLVVIIAGYSENMDEFLNSNPGLKSRFSTIIDFPDYSVEELCQIAVTMYEDNELKLTQEAADKIYEIMDEAVETKTRHFGNARYVRNVVEASEIKQSRRLSKRPGENAKEKFAKLTNDELAIIEDCDIEFIRS